MAIGRIREIAFDDGAVVVGDETLSDDLGTSDNDPNTIVRRDASGDFAAGTITADLDGNASSADTATTATTATTAGDFTGSLSGDVTGTQSATAIAATTVTGKALTGFTSGAGAVAATDSILQGIQKINGNVADLRAIPTAMLDPTGFEDHENIGVAYNSADQKITVTHSSGTIYYWVNGVRYSKSSPWLSTAHTNTLSHVYWLSINAAGDSVWTTDASPGFDKCLVAQCLYYTGFKFGVKECHGINLPHSAHQDLHANIGAYRKSGGSAVAGSYAVTTNTIAAVTPDIDSIVFEDEDLPSTIAAFAAAEGYTQLYFDTNAPVFVPGAALPYIVTGTPSSGNPRYNQNPVSGTALTTITTNNNRFNVYCIFIPVTSDAASQVFRIVWLTGQSVYTSLSAAQSEDFRGINVGPLAGIFREFLPYIRWTFVKVNSNLTYDTQLAAGPTYLAGSTAALIAVSGVSSSDHNTLTGRSDADSHPASAITGTAVTLAGAEVLTNKDLDGGTASNANRVTIPKNTTANLLALTRKEATIVYDTTTKKPYLDDGSALKVIGGGLITEVKSANFAAVGGKHYLVDFSGAPNTDITVTLAAGAAESVIRFSTNNGSPVGTGRLILTPASGEKLQVDGVLGAANETAKMLGTNTYCQIAWDTGLNSAAGAWLVDDPSVFVTGTFAGDLAITGGLTVDTTTLVVDKTNNRVGVGTATPSVALDVVGVGKFSSGIIIGDDTLSVYDEGNFLVYLVDGTNKTTLANAYYTQVGKLVSITLPAKALTNTTTTRLLTSTDSASTYTWPAALTPAHAVVGFLSTIVAGVNSIGYFSLSASGVFSFSPDVLAGAWSSSNNEKGCNATTITYHLA